MYSEPRLVAISDNGKSKVFLTDGFASSGFAVHLLSQNDNAAEYLRRHRVDLLLLDTTDDPRKEIAMLKSLRKEWPRESLPVIVMTDITDYDTQLQLLEAGASDFILKPLEIDEVAERVRTALDRSDQATTILEDERQRVLTEALARASSTTAVAIGGMIDELEGAINTPQMPASQMQACLHDVLALTERTVAVIDRIRRIATLKEVPYATRSHLLEKLSDIS